ncbi:MAG: hypothetical protein AB1409_08125 [Pseudomonadota bacterium]
MRKSPPPFGILTRDERSLINKRANELARRAYDAYQWRLVEWAAMHKRETGQKITLDVLSAVVPDITDDLQQDVGEEKPF